MGVGSEIGLDRVVTLGRIHEHFLLLAKIATNKQPPRRTLRDGLRFEVQVDGSVGLPIVEGLCVVARPDDVVVLGFRKHIELLANLAHEVELLIAHALAALDESVVVDSEHDVIERTVDDALVHEGRFVLQHRGELVALAHRFDVHVAVVEEVLARALLFGHSRFGGLLVWLSRRCWGC